MIKEVVILGASGRIGSALLRHAKAIGLESRCVARKQYNAWQRIEDAQETLVQYGFSQSSLLVCAAGIIDPKADSGEIERINYKIPSMACDAAVHLGGKAVSLGTVLEKVIPYESQNPYVKSKTKLQNAANTKWLHLQLHTVYGGQIPTSFMFTGLMLNALKRNERFSMTPGNQLREYHHVDDEAAAIIHLAQNVEHGSVDVSSGKSIMLSDLARGVFSHFNKLELLGIGDLKSPEVESYDPVFELQPFLFNHSFRPALPAVPQWLSNYL